MSETKGRCRKQIEESYAHNRNCVPRYAWITADAIDRLAADVASIKAKVDAVSPEDVRHFVDSEKAWVKLVEDQRDAAVRERNEARALLELAQVQRTAAYADRDEARAEVYRLKCSMTETSKERDAAIRERDAANQRRADTVRRLVQAQAEVAQLRDSSDVANRLFGAEQAKVERLRKELEQRQPDGNRPEKLDSSPAAPQPAATAAGWLTEEERAVVKDIASMIQQWFKMAWSDTDEKRCAVLRSILSRAGSPPVVVLPTVFQRGSLGDKLVALQQVKDAMDAAGVPWEEVGRE